ncbi:heme ABC transporter ATP-binding protein [Paenibacillus sp. PL91]|uniref:heme ABC transporter ATP-binding protein n=1 Tax=Paenibacillus sp. PL91 TaxID=2729538 RepID=UPI00145F8181|nr:heme ABC transporter ATP-binding protein [Paenibacillus sp. PL91]MBC9199438.1 heme ABC transporter ATP-binding protein [Paenibacillus sp. PL91]
MIEVRHIVQAVQGRTILNGISCSFQKGRMYGIIGPNGVGKSTLLQLLSGVDQPKQGEILLAGRNIASYPRKQLAKKLAVLQQSGLPPVGFSVREVVSMGRYPFQNWLGSEEQDFEPIIDRALSAMGLEELEHRKMDQLSGGERQRVALAKLMAQEPTIILLDEPTTYLDIGFQVQLLDTVRAWQQERELTVIAVLHDLNLAALYCDELVVLHQGKVAAAGIPHSVLTPTLIERVYETTAAVIAHPVTGVPQIMLQPNWNNESARSGLKEL